MKTGKTVVDEKEKLTDEQIGKIQKKANEIVRRINEGTISYEDSLEVMQKIIIENKSAKHLDVLTGRASIVPFKKSWEENGVIHFKVTSDGTTGEEWIERLERQSFKLTDWAKRILLSKDFDATKYIEYEIVILRNSLFAKGFRNNRKIRNEALKRKLSTPNVEIGCLTRQMFSDEELRVMGIDQIVVMHKPIIFSDNGSVSALTHICVDDGGFLEANYGGPNDSYDHLDGFVFEVSRTKVV
jgi:hypothetical protein